MTVPSSPCRKICRMDRSNRLCTACGRTLAEIASWGSLSEAQRLAVMSVLPARLARAQAADASERCSEPASE